MVIVSRVGVNYLASEWTILSLYTLQFTFSALTLLVGQEAGHPVACKNLC